MGAAFGVARVAFDVLCDASVEEAGALFAAVEPLLGTTRRSLRQAFQVCFLDRLAELPDAWVASRAPLLGPAARAHRDTPPARPRWVPWYFDDLRPSSAARTAAAEALLARFVAVSPSFVRTWDEQRDVGGAAEFDVFAVLTLHVTRLLEIGQRASLPGIFVEVERSMRATSPPPAEDDDDPIEEEPIEREAARVTFLENVAREFPGSYAQVLALLGPESLAYVRRWASRYDAMAGHLAADEARAIVIDPLGAACPSFAREWMRGGARVSAGDGGTSAAGLAWFAFDVFTAAPNEDATALLQAIEPLLATEERGIGAAFRSCFLERLVELPLARLRFMRERLGPAARTYWDHELRLGELRLVAVEGSRLVNRAALRPGDSWDVAVTLPDPEVGEELHAVLRRGEVVVRERRKIVYRSGSCYVELGEPDAAPPDDGSVEVWVGGRALGTVPVSLIGP